jgi:hypothetical protein
LAKISDEGANSQLLFVLLEWLVMSMCSTSLSFGELTVDFHVEPSTNASAIFSTEEQKTKTNKPNNHLPCSIETVTACWEKGPFPNRAGNINAKNTTIGNSKRNVTPNSTKFIYATCENTHNAPLRGF